MHVEKKTTWCEVLFENNSSIIGIIRVGEDYTIYKN